MTAAGALPARWVGPALVVAGALCIGFAPIGMRLSEFGPQATAFWRYAFSLPVMLALVWGRGEKMGRPSKAALLAGLFFGLDMVFWHWSLTLTSVANATFIVSLGYVSVGFIAWIALREQPTRIWLIALAIALAGALMLSRGAHAAEEGELRGDLLALFAGLMVGLYLFFTRIARQTERAMPVLFWATMVECAVGLIACAVFKESILPPDPSWLIMPALLAIVAHVAGQGLITAGVGRTPAAIAGLLLLVQPVAAAAIAWPLFGEPLTPVQLGGAGLILCGVWLAGRSRS